MPKKNEGAIKRTKRGTQDELEIIGLIVAENHVLRKRVLDILKRAKQSYTSNLKNSGKTDVAG